MNDALMKMDTTASKHREIGKRMLSLMESDKQYEP